MERVSNKLIGLIGASLTGHADALMPAFVPGHTSGHIAYWFAEDRALFCGDTLFSIGCGRLFEGTPAEVLSLDCPTGDDMLNNSSDISRGHYD